MSTIKQLWTLAKFQLAVTPGVSYLAIGSGFSCIAEFVLFVLFRDSKGPTSLDLLISNQLIYFVLIFGSIWLVPNLGGGRKRQSIGAAGTEFLLTRAVDRHLLFRSRSLLFFFLLLIIPLICFAFSLHQPGQKLFESNGSLYQRVMQELPGSMPQAPDTDGKLKYIFLPEGNILIGMWRIWSPLFLGITTLSLLTFAQKYKYVWWLFSPLGLVLVIFYCFPTVFSHGFFGVERDELDPNTAFFFFYATHQTLCWLIAIPALFLSLLWYERDARQIN